MNLLPEEIKAYQGREVKQKRKKLVSVSYLSDLFEQIKKRRNTPEASLFHSLHSAIIAFRKKIIRTHRIKMTPPQSHSFHIMLKKLEGVYIHC